MNIVLYRRRFIEKQRQDAEKSSSRHVRWSVIKSPPSQQTENVYSKTIHFNITSTEMRKLSFWTFFPSLHGSQIRRGNVAPHTIHSLQTFPFYMSRRGLSKPSTLKTASGEHFSHTENSFLPCLLMRCHSLTKKIEKKVVINVNSQLALVVVVFNLHAKCS